MPPTRWIYSPLTSGLIITGLVFSGSPCLGQTETEVNPFGYRCPFLLKPLLTEIFPDLPSYINRSIQRQKQAGEPLRYLIALSNPDYRPASLEGFSDRHPELNLGPLLETSGLYQVFLTSRERLYDGDRIQDFQEFHWLLFQQNDRYKWELRAMFSQDQQGNIRNSRGEPIAQGIEQRLQDCWVGEK